MQCGVCSMIIDELNSKHIPVEDVSYGAAEKKYIVTMRNPGMCSCGGHATKTGPSAFRKILDLEKDELITLHIALTRYRCNQCSRYMFSADMDAWELIMPEYKLCSDEATVYLIRKMLARPGFRYEDIAEEFGVSAGGVCKTFRGFLEEVRQKIIPLIPSQQIILHPIKHRRITEICVFGADSSGHTGLQDIIQPDQVGPYFEWLNHLKRFNPPKRIACDFKQQQELLTMTLDPSTELVLTDEALAEFQWYITEKFGEDFVSQIRELGYCEKQLKRLCETIPVKRRGRNFALIDEIYRYAFAYHNRCTYDAEYVKATIKQIETLKTRKYDNTVILLWLMFTSSLHRDALLNTKYAKYVINEENSPS